MCRRVFNSLWFIGLGVGAACFDVDVHVDAPIVAGSSTTMDPAEGMPTTGEPAASSGAAGTTGIPATGEGTSATSGGGMAAPSCGNGVVEEGEACDEGFNGNGDDQACTSSCQLASCGDGHLQPVNQEACDDGPQNVPTPGYEQCSTSCQPGPYCGDGVLQPDDGEDCEPGQGESDNCTEACVYQSRYVFLTSMAVGGDLGGVAGADALCNMLVAESPGLSGTYRAWLLVDGQSLADRFPEFAGISTWNFVNTAGEPLAKSFMALVVAGPAHPVMYTEAGDLAAEQYVWTNITAAGQAAGGDCDQWTGVDGAALVGLSGYQPDEGPDAEQWHAKRWWTDADGYVRLCHDFLPHLYCVQVAG